MIPLWPGWRLVECQMRSIGGVGAGDLEALDALVVPEAVVDLEADPGHRHHLERVDPVPLVGRQRGAVEVDLLAQDCEGRREDDAVGGERADRAAGIAVGDARSRRGLIDPVDRRVELQVRAAAGDAVASARGIWSRPPIEVVRRAPVPVERALDQPCQRGRGEDLGAVLGGVQALPSGRGAARSQELRDGVAVPLVEHGAVAVAVGPVRGSAERDGGIAEVVGPLGRLGAGHPLVLVLDVLREERRGLLRGVRPSAAGQPAAASKRKRSSLIRYCVAPCLPAPERLAELDDLAAEPELGRRSPGCGRASRGCDARPLPGTGHRRTERRPGSCATGRSALARRRAPAPRG